MSSFEEEFKSHLLQVQMSAQGCCSGTLKEWPLLRTALDYFGVKVSWRHSMVYVNKISRLVYEEESQRDIS